jgi:polysaccharide export outer membrane protein
MLYLKYISRIAGIALLVSLVANARGQDIASAKSNTAPASANTPPFSREEAGTISATSQLVLGPADVIRINVWKNSDLTQTVTVGPDGFVSLPLLGDVHVAGMTANQLGQELKSRLASFVMSAQVTVSVVEIKSRQVYVTGQVGKPGGYPLITPISVLQLIAQAGGLNTFANRKEILILRGIGSNVQRLKFNYNSAVHGDAKQNISLQPGDTVIVP